MRNLKHTIAALVAVSLVGSLAAKQAVNFSAVKANRLNPQIEAISTAPEILTGDGEGETEEFAFFSNDKLKISGKSAYILTEEGGSINLRAKANTESTILDVLDVGTEISILGGDGEWLNVETGGYKGFIKSEFITYDYEEVKKVLLASVMYQNGSVKVSSNVHGTPDENSLILDLVPEGASVTILETTDNGWHKVYFGENYDIGYLPCENVTIGDMVNRAEIDAKRSVRIFSVAKNATIVTGNSVVTVKLLPSEESETLTTLANGAKCLIISGGSNWTKIIVSATNEIGYVKTSEVKKIVEPAKPKANKSKKSSTAGDNTVYASAGGSKLVAQASKYIGTRYVYGGTSPSGFDCSGLVQYSMRKLGVSLPRSSGAQYGCGTSVSRNNLKPGDLVFFSRGGGISHVAIYAGNGQVIHAPRAGKTVCYQSLNSLATALHYVGAKRVL